MKVFFPFAYYYPEQCAGIYVVDDIMEALAKVGIESYMSVPTPTRNVVPDAQWSRTEEKCDGKVVVHRFRMYGEGKNPVLRALRYFICECIQLHALLWKDYDMIFIDSTPPIQGLKLSIVRFFRKKPVIYNLHDLFPDSLVGSGLAKQGGLLWRIGTGVMNITYHNIDRIITISRDIKNNLMVKGVSPEKIDVVYNWVDEKTVQPVAKENNPLFEEFGLSRDKFTLVYAGNLGNAQNISIILDAAKRFNVNDNFDLNQDIQFVIFGTGGLEDELRKEIVEDQLTNVHLFPLQPFERVSQVYSLGDACIVSCKAGLGGSAMPSKTWTIMSCGRPVIASFDEGELKDILEGRDNDNRKPCGVFTHAGNLQEFVEGIKSLVADPSSCEEMGKNARQFILDNLTKEVGTKKYVEIIKRIALGV